MGFWGFGVLGFWGFGIEEVRVRSIHQKDGIFKLVLDKKLHNVEAIVFVVIGQQYDTTKVRIIEYDNETNTLIIKPQEDLQERFAKIFADEIKIISDLKFLVERTRVWYQHNGDKIRLPTSKSSLTFPNGDNFFVGTKPSPDQAEAIKTIFNKPLSYIWGAPGTGKTQLVLAYSLIHYIQSGKKVAIFAATNNALEQILYGVLSITKKAGIQDSMILRLGTPSSKFAQTHPDSCELVGVQQKFREIDNQIKIVKGVLESNTVSKILSSLEAKSSEILSQLKQIEISRGETLLATNVLQAKLEKKLSSSNLALSHIAELEKNIKRSERTISSFAYFLKKNFLGLPDTDELELEKKKAELNDKLKESKKLEEETEVLENELKDLKFSYSDFSKIDALLHNLKDICSVDAQASSLVSAVTFQNLESTQSSLTNYLKKRADELTSSGMIAPEYSSWTEQEMLEKLKSWEEQKDDIESQSEEQINKANVVALTLDCYISRYKDKDLPGEHYFLDEAGYACLIKALTLFRKNVPITFLGDHKQLPPVCEFDDNKMGDTEMNREIFMWAQSALYMEWLFKKTKSDAFLDYEKNIPFSFVDMEKVDLRKTYRFGSALAEKLNQFVYNNGFSSCEEGGETQIYYIHAPHIHPQPVVNTNGVNKPSRENIFEVNKIVELVNNLDQESFAILTPYKKQVALLGQMLPNARRDLRIMTVHGSQGKEWNDVVLSIVDTDRMWFVDTLNKSSRGINVVNTAVSRAKKRLFIVCNYEFWIRQDKQLIKGLLDVAKPVS
jgi:hypothetical protein